jgi:hypothetical protein
VNSNKTKYAAPLGLGMNLVFGATKMPRLWRSGARVVSTRSAGMGWTVKIIRRCLFADVLRLGTSRAPKERPAEAQGFGKKDECGFLPKAATPGWK